MSKSFAEASDVELYPKAVIGESVDDRVDGRVRDGEKMSGNVEQLEQPWTVAETLMGRVVVAEKVETQLKDVHRKPEHSVENDDGHERFDSLGEQRTEMNILAINAFVPRTASVQSRLMSTGVALIIAPCISSIDCQYQKRSLHRRSTTSPV